MQFANENLELGSTNVRKIVQWLTVHAQRVEKADSLGIGRRPGLGLQSECPWAKKGVVNFSDC